ncbi:unnamed protein product, partial [Discosporangium mesarthrocarpum]
MTKKIGGKKGKTGPRLGGVPPNKGRAGDLRDETLQMIKDLGITEEVGSLDTSTPVPPGASKSRNRADGVRGKGSRRNGGDGFANNHGMENSGWAGSKEGLGRDQVGGRGSSVQRVDQRGQRRREGEGETGGQGRGDDSQHWPGANRDQDPPAGFSGVGKALGEVKIKHPFVDSEGQWFEAVPANIKGSDNRASKRRKKPLLPTPEEIGEGKSGSSVRAEGSVTPEGIRELHSAAKAVLDAEVAAWEEQRARHATGDDRWVEQVLRTGTLSDKVAALTLKVQESPTHRLSTLDRLLDLALKKERRTAQMALEGVKDLFINNLLPDGRRLVVFEARPLAQVVAAVAATGATAAGPGMLGARARGGGGGGGGGISQAAGKALAMWYFESQARFGFYRVVAALERGSSDTVENFKRFCLETAKELLEAKPEGEAQLLSLLVNKLGDPQRKISSKVIHLLQTLLSKHPAMKPVVVREVQQYLHRQGLQPRAIYAGVVFLNQARLSSVYLTAGEDAALASSLVQTYLQIFEGATATTPTTTTTTT